MTATIIVASILITLALVFYSIGVWSERIAGRLKGWHLVFFWAGLACDSAGTGIMFEVAGGISSDIHSVTGIIAILLMIIHATTAIYTEMRSPGIRGEPGLLQHACSSALAEQGRKIT